MKPMKTNQEIQVEAGRLVALGSRYRDEHRERMKMGIGSAVPRVVAQFPESRVTSLHDAARESDSVHVHRFQRVIDALMVDDKLVYRLLEKETETNGLGVIVREDKTPEVLMFGRSGVELLFAGYELIDEERLAESLTPFAEPEEGEDKATVAREMETVLETDLLSAAERMRSKLDIQEFLDGRLEAHAFIARAIERQRTRASVCETMSVRNEIKLTLDEP